MSLLPPSCPCLASLSQTNRYYRPADIKEDILECNSAELSFALAHFIQEVRRPNGETYSPDSIFYLCLGIQQVQTLVGSHLPPLARVSILDLLCLLLFGQYLFMEGRIENIFTDPLYNQFTVEITQMLRVWRPKSLPSGMNRTRMARSLRGVCQPPNVALTIP